MGSRGGGNSERIGLNLATLLIALCTLAVAGAGIVLQIIYRQRDKRCNLSVDTTWSSGYLTFRIRNNGPHSAFNVHAEFLLIDLFGSKCAKRCNLTQAHHLPYVGQAETFTIQTGFIASSINAIANEDGAFVVPVLRLWANDEEIAFYSPRDAIPGIGTSLLTVTSQMMGFAHPGVISRIGDANRRDCRRALSTRKRFVTV
jgi:hypothetical protein